MELRLELGLLITASFFVAACGGADEDAQEEAIAAAEGAVIVGDVDWTSTTALSGTKLERSAAVGYLKIPAKLGRCTAWLAAPDVAVTNHHCISNAAEAVGALISFNYVDGVSPQARVWYSCSTVLATWPEIDMTALQCAPINNVPPGDVYGVLSVSSATPSIGSGVYVIHQNCDYYYQPGCSPSKKHSPGILFTTSYDSLSTLQFDDNITYSADTLGGSSGSPVLASVTDAVIGLHHWGLAGDNKGRGLANAAAKGSKIRGALKELQIASCGDGGAAIGPNCRVLEFQNPEVIKGVSYVVAPNHGAPGVYYQPVNGACPYGGVLSQACRVLSFAPGALEAGVHYLVDTNPPSPSVYYKKVKGGCPHGGAAIGARCRIHVFSAPPVYVVQGVSYSVDTSPGAPAIYYAPINGACPYAGALAGARCRLLALGQGEVKPEVAYSVDANPLRPGVYY